MLSQKHKGHKIISDFNTKLPYVKLDNDKFQQIMTNLIDNACKYSPEGKTVTISTAFAIRLCLFLEL